MDVEKNGSVIGFAFGAGADDGRESSKEAIEFCFGCDMKSNADALVDVEGAVEVKGNADAVAGCSRISSRPNISEASDALDDGAPESCGKAMRNRESLQMKADQKVER